MTVPAFWSRTGPENFYETIENPSNYPEKDLDDLLSSQ